MRRTMIDFGLRPLLACLLLVAGASCGDGSVEPLPLQITLAASRTTAAPGDVIEFLVTAQGGNLVGVAIDYGDGFSEIFPAGGARTARVTFVYAYEAAGTYQVKAEVADGLNGGEREATLEVRVQ